MKPKPDSYDEFILESTGRIAYANCLIVGINPKLEVSQGYDGGFGPYFCGPNDQEGASLTKTEREELADYMIDLWKQYKNKP